MNGDPEFRENEQQNYEDSAFSKDLPFIFLVIIPRSFSFEEMLIRIHESLDL